MINHECGYYPFQQGRGGGGGGGGKGSLNFPLPLTCTPGSCQLPLIVVPASVCFSYCKKLCNVAKVYFLFRDGTRDFSIWVLGPT